MNDDASLRALAGRIEALRLRSPEAFRRRARLAVLGALAPIAALAALAVVALALAARALPPWGLLVLTAGAAFGIGGAIAGLKRPEDPAPAGWPLASDRAPRLHELVDAVGARVGAASVGAILLTGDANASVVRLRGRNVLLIGWPLLNAIGADELRAILAHELSHLATPRGVHGSALAAWRQLIARRARRSPRLAAWRLAASRELEREADAAAARETSARTTADALTRVPLVTARLLECWPAARARARAMGAGEVAPFTGMSSLREASPSDERTLAAALGQVTQPWDAHPSLAERLRSLGAEPRVPPPPASVAAELLDDAGLEAARVLDEAWRAAWMQAHAEDAAVRDLESRSEVRRGRLRSARSRRVELERIALARELEPSEAWEHAAAVGELDGPDAERALLERAVLREPAHAASCFELGRLRLQAGDASGAELLERAAGLSPSLRVRCAELLLGHAVSDGRHEDAAIARTALTGADALDEAARRERASLPLRAAHYEGHGLGDDAVRQLSRACASLHDVRLALLLRRRIALLPERRAWLLAVEREPGHDASGAARRDDEVARQLLPLVEDLGDVACVVASLEGRAFVAGLASVPGAVVHRREV